ncbi:MAG TPA: thiamine pyrophosphate-dependent enzyme [Syntrophales bacterium]|nr:thiamine pyrophosphate-dependent enzyme [Syntrophales bacterium]
MDNSELTYFDKSRREFIKLSGLTIAGMVLPLSLGQASAAYGAAGPLSADRAAALALQDAGVKVVTHVPATGATAVFDAYCGLAGKRPAYSFNEEVAYTVAHGAALAGVRSAAVLKSHGLAKASNSVIDSLTLGTTAGFVAVVLDDPTGKHSDNIFDLDAFLRGTGIPFKKAEADTAYNDLMECCLWSEGLKTPVALLVSSEHLSRKSGISRKRLQSPKCEYERDPVRQVLCPPIAPYQKKVMEARISRTDWRSVPRPVIPSIPEGLAPAWRSHASSFVPVFEVFRDLRPGIPFVSGDTGLSTLFAFAPFNCIDASSYFGGSLPLAIGFALGASGRPWAVTGDYAFLAAGHMGLFEALARRLPLKVLIMDNGGAMATGGQPVPAGVLETAMSAWSPFVSRIDNPRDKAAVRQILARAAGSDRLEIVWARFR